MKPIKLGSETEYAISCQAAGTSMAAEDVAPLVVEAVGRNHPSLPDVREGVSRYLGNGSRVYREIGGKVEHATPECSSPEEVARYDKAGERIFARARATLAEQHPEWRLVIFKNNVGSIAPDDTTWGNHESYTCWVAIDSAVRPLMGHLVSRLFYAGAGLLAYREGGMGFELSQRARHLVKITGDETTSVRPLFCTRIRKPSDISSAGWVRAHLICKDSQRSPFGMYLTFGTTGLLFHLLHTGWRVGHRLAPKDPIAAVRAVSQDRWLKTPIALEDGRRLTAMQIQWEYLTGCDRAVRSGDAPDWGPELIRHWRETLEAWEKDPISLADRLDTACKLKIIDHELVRGGMDWSRLNDGLKLLGGLRRRYPVGVVRAVLIDDTRGLTAEERPKFPAARAELGPERRSRLDQLRFVARLQAIDLNYHELGGLYDALEVAGQVKGIVAEPADIARAVDEPPPGGRAAYRGAFIRQHQQEGWSCDWAALVRRASGQIIRLADPFVEGPTSSAPAASASAGSGLSELEMYEFDESFMGPFDPDMGPQDRERIAAILSRIRGRR